MRFLLFTRPPAVVIVALAWRDMPATALVEFAMTGRLSRELYCIIAG